jgi:uncharacterized protein YeeX (DUF496 family)
LVVGSAKLTRIEQELEDVERKRYDLEEIMQTLATLEIAHKSRHAVLNAEFETEKRELTRRIRELERQAEQTASRRNSMQKART